MVATSLTEHGLIDMVAVRARIAQAVSMLAPAGGLNDLDPLAAMPDGFALTLHNWVPDTGTVRVRPGYRKHLTGLTKAIDTLLVYNDAAGTITLLAATADGLYDATTPTASPVLAYAAIEGAWSYVNFSTVGVAYLVAVNGVDPGFLYDGTAFTTMTETTTPTNPGQIDGVNPADLIDVTSHNGRLWFVQTDSLVAWYLPVNQVGGLAKPFYIGGIVKRGGRLLAIRSWSVDSGDGMSDKLAFITNTGEVAVYSGSDPDTVDTWGLEALYYLATPAGARAVLRFGGDIVLVTTMGVVSLSSAMSSSISQALYSGTLSRRVNRTLNRILVKLGSTFVRSFESLSSTDFDLVVLNVPKSNTSDPTQFVMNVQTGAWSTTDYPISTMAYTKQSLFFGTEDGSVMQSTIDMTLDEIEADGSGGTPITSYVMSGFSYLGDPSMQKHFKFLRPVFQANSPPSYALRVVVDYELSPLGRQPVTPTTTSASLWDLAIWDFSSWASFGETYRPWNGADALGYAGAVQMRMTTTNDVSLVAFEWIFEPGGLI